ncbi:hypothetical protein [Dyadobacter tibetensis]|uniref:hypothetical protein n=1 Tax=Dyadobacter tibetensis TaxID=1211851 RepID=UPI000470C8BD|nr:hypothetical protein [Dyadobacter tibetensis]
MKNWAFASLIVFMACCKGTSSDCPYFEGISLYFKDELYISLNDIKDEHIFYVLDLQACEQCVNLNTNMLMRVKANKKLTIVFVGETFNKQFLNRVAVLKKRFEFLTDTKMAVYGYQTNLAKPLLIHVNKGHCVNVIDVIDPKISEAEVYINSI